MKDALTVKASKGLLGLLTFIVLAALVLAPARSLAAGTQALRGHVPPVTAHLTPIGRLPATQRLNLALGVPLRNREALTNLLQALYDPSSPLFHQYLSPAEFTARFGPSEADYQGLLEFAQTNGLTVAKTYTNRTLLDVNATVGDIERAFHLTMRVYQHPKEARTFYAPDAEPTVTAAVPLLDISGLSDSGLPRPRVRKVEPVPAGVQVQPHGGSGAGGTYMGKDFRAAYAPGVNLTGAGQVVGLLQFDGYYPSDIAAYASQAGLPNVPLQNVLLDGYDGTPTSGANSGSIEVSLDIEMVISMAPGVSKILVYEAGPSGTPNHILNQMAVDNVAKQIGCSWGWSGGPTATTDQYFQQMVAQGQSFFTASGDSDAFTTGEIDNASNTDTPSDNPYITVVGGTTLSTTGPGGAYISETVWNRNNGVGSSGGISSYYTIPTWQQGINMSLPQGSTTHRNIPDVALTAENVLVLYNGNATAVAVGGTSCAAPLWAGFAALVNQQAAAAGKPPVGFLNPALYSLGKGTNYNGNFHDTTEGNNFDASSPNLFSAVAGYDLCTGWGTPNGSTLINSLAPIVLVPVLTNAGISLLMESCLPTNGVIDPGETVVVNLALQNAGPISTTNLTASLLASGGVLAPNGPQNYGALSGLGATLSRPFTFTANGTCGGTVTATLQLQDGATSLGTVTFSLPLGQAIGVAANQNFDGATAPMLPAGWSSVAVTGLWMPWLTTTAAADTGSNAGFIPDSEDAGANALVSPVITMPTPAPQLTFRHNYNLENARFRGHTTYYDGAVLEIAINNGAFTDIVSAGGSFAAGGYNGSITTSSDNPLGGRSAWVGNSGAWVTTRVNLPTSAAGQKIQLRWSCATDNGNVNGGTGWYVDSISSSLSYYTCCSDSADIAVSQMASPTPATAGQNLTYLVSVTNAGPQAAYNVAVTDTLPANAGFVSASSGCTYSNGNVYCTFGLLAPGVATNLTITVLPLSSGALSNAVNVTSVTPDSNAGNNAALLVTPMTADVAPVITGQPTNTTVVQGANASFLVTATGTPAPVYQWRRNGAALSDATASALNLGNVQVAQAGSYTVVVTNAAGSVTSTPALLRVLVPPALTGMQTGNGGASWSFQSELGLTYTLEYKQQLSDGLWTPLPPALTGTGGTLVLQDTNAVMGSRYYRVRCE